MIAKRIDELISQNKIIAKGMVLLEESFRESVPERRQMNESEERRPRPLPRL
jgi:hypothetical protein